MLSQLFCSDTLYSLDGEACLPCPSSPDVNCKFACLTVAAGLWWSTQSTLMPSTHFHACNPLVCGVYYLQAVNGSVEVPAVLRHAETHVQAQLNRTAIVAHAPPPLTSHVTSTCAAVITACAPGHVQSSPLCAVCEEGWAHTFGPSSRCAECMSTGVNAVLTVLVCVCVCGYIAFMVVRTVHSQASRSGSTSRMTVWFGQRVPRDETVRMRCV